MQQNRPDEHMITKGGLANTATSEYVERYCTHWRIVTYTLLVAYIEQINVLNTFLVFLTYDDCWVFTFHFMTELAPAIQQLKLVPASVGSETYPGSIGNSPGEVKLYDFRSRSVETPSTVTGVLTWCPPIPNLLHTVINKPGDS